MLIAALPEVLRWSGPVDVLARSHQAYSALLGGQLGGVLARIARREPATAAELLTRIQALPDAALTRLLTAPQTCHRLLWPERHAAEALASFLASAVTAELAGLDPAQASDEETWSALGDLRSSRAGGVQRAPRPSGLMPLDFDSPFVQSVISPAASAPHQPASPEQFDDDERRAILGRFDVAARGMRATSETVFGFAVAYNKVVILHKSASSDRFLTRSPEKLIGLAVFRNAHRPDVDAVDLAEGMVHEAIHTVLDIDEYTRQREGAGLAPWLQDLGLYDGATRTCSPWTGNPLPVHTYLHACFVWYGLVHFWALALATSAFDRARVQHRLAVAARGFVRGDALDEIRPFRDVIAPDLLEAVARMQDHVKRAWP
jgi:hypothetical protein